MKRAVFEKRAAEMKQRLLEAASVTDTAYNDLGERTFNLSETAEQLGVSYSTARRLCNQANVRRYSTNVSGVVYPGSTLKRFQRVRFTYVVTESDLMTIKMQMRGISK